MALKFENDIFSFVHQLKKYKQIDYLSNAFSIEEKMLYIGGITLNTTTKKSNVNTAQANWLCWLSQVSVGKQTFINS